MCVSLPVDALLANNEVSTGRVAGSSVHRATVVSDEAFLGPVVRSEAVEDLDTGGGVLLALHHSQHVHEHLVLPFQLLFLIFQLLDFGLQPLEVSSNTGSVILSQGFSQCYEAA